MKHTSHGPRRSAIDLGNGIATGRYNKGLDQYPHEEAFRVLYLGLAREVCMGETMRHINPADHDSVLRQLKRRYSRLRINDLLVVDCVVPSDIDLSYDDMLEDDFTHTHLLAEAARALNIEGLLVPSATRLGDNLIVLVDPEPLVAAGRLTVVDYIDPPLAPRET